MLDTCLHKLGHFFVGELHFTGKDFLLDAGREIICDVDASCMKQRCRQPLPSLPRAKRC